MRIYFDESGDYSFSGADFDSYVQVAIICPDSNYEAATEFVDASKKEWGVEELHATKLEPEQLNEIVAFIRDSNYRLAARVTDTEIVTNAKIDDFRLSQAKRTADNLSDYKKRCKAAGKTPAPQVVAWMNRQIKRAGLVSQIPQGEFMQAVGFAELVSDVLQKCLYGFVDDKWKNDLTDFRFIFDGKIPEKLAAGEKYLNETLLPGLGSRPHMALGVPDTWAKDPKHPFLEKFGVKNGEVAGKKVAEGVDIKKVFEHGLEFETSEDHAGIQLADVAAHTIRDVILRPDDKVTQHLFEGLKQKLTDENGECLRVSSFTPDKASRYRTLAKL